MQSERELTAASIRDRVLIVTALIALTPLALLVVELPTRTASVNFLGSPLSINLSTDSLLVVLIPVLTCAGVDWVLRDHPDVRAGEVPYLFPFWIAPVFAALALSLLLTRIPTWPLWIVVLAIGVVMIGVLVFAEYVSLSPNARGYAAARLVLTGVSYAIAFVLFTHLYSARERSIISATLTSLVAAGLALDLMAPHIIGLRTAAVFSGDRRFPGRPGHLGLELLEHLELERRRAAAGRVLRADRSGAAILPGSPDARRADRVRHRRLARSGRGLATGRRAVDHGDTKKHGEIVKVFGMSDLAVPVQYSVARTISSPIAGVMR